ncbi:branched-chain amino acid transport system permease protein [Paucibacter oligotrophus]|uniref:Branched-chain amino acid transport system permease protein n=1 Tax=Roseateles oligotrophus TaxID=1769250 RepID=A0A840LDI8_9BURK|nr:branched-chain amino acid ABC transporter permease [Roseateles oligotrophus]MBB4846236.1 branched-chain amino acid transport system permease protein [Roseateles oligotrophus]
MKSSFPWLSAICVLLAVAPFLLPDFWTLNILARALSLGIVALSLSFLVRYCNMVSLCQMSIAGVAGYVLALLSTNSTGLGVVVPWPYAIAAALLAATLFGALVGWVSYRSSDVYLLMLTLAIAVCTLFFIQQNMEVFNGFDGISGLAAPAFLADPDTRSDRLYWLIAAISILAFSAFSYAERTPLGMTLQAMRDNPRRFQALGYNMRNYRVIAFALAGAIAGVGGVLTTLYNAQVSPGTIDVQANVAILVMCVLGGQKRPAGAFLGALLYILLEVYSPQLFSRERFNLLLGSTFLLILYFSPDGLMGLLSHRSSRFAAKFRRGKAATLSIKRRHI